MTNCPTTNASIVLIDSGVTNYQNLIKGIVPDTDLAIIRSDRDGTLQITDVLSQKNYRTVHLITHGSPGCLYLGNSQLSLQTLDRYSQNLAKWAGIETLLLYGCNVAAGDAGEEFIAKLHKITGIEIAASTTLVGNNTKGGNWDLDYQTNIFCFREQQTSLAFTPQLQENYAGVFAVTTSGNVFIDYNNDGDQQIASTSSVIAEEANFEGVTVTAFDANGNILDSVETDENGNYTLSTPDNTAIRVEFSDLPEGFVGSSIAGDNSVPEVFFLDDSLENTDITANFGIHRPSEVTSGNSEDIDLITVCYVEGIGGPGTSAIVIHNYNDSGEAPYTPLVNVQEIGTVNGLAYHRESSTLFAGSFYKRHSALLGTIDRIVDGDASASSNDANGVAYTSVIYSIDNAGNVVEFARLDDVVDPRGEVTSEDIVGYWQRDAGADGTTAQANAIFDAVGKTGLGDVELSEDGLTLWAVNLNDNNLYQLPVGGNSDPLNPTPPSAGEINNHDIITQIINNGDDLGVNPQQNVRPFALSTRDGLVYIGMVNTAQFDAAGVEGNLTADDLRAFVYAFDPNNPSAAPVQVLDIPLNYERDQVINNGSTSESANWNPWVGEWPDPDTFFAGEVAYAQPILSDIEFDPDGNMILGFRDRWGDQIGSGVQAPDGDDNNGTLFSGDSGGDILQAIFDDTTGTWTIETHVTTDGINGNNDPDGEFFRNEFFEQNGVNDSTSVHAETAQGGLALVPGFTEVVTTALDPIAAFSGGYEWFNTEDGSFSGHEFGDFSGLEIFDIDTADGLGKANGLGDVEFIAAPATLEIGDRIWFDTNQNGIQDVGENDVPNGIEVELYLSGGTTALQTTTTTSGSYFFAGLAPLTNYEVRLVASDFVTGADLAGFQATLQNSGSNDALDSDATNSVGVPTIFLTTGTSGTNDHSYDIGLTNTPTFDYGDAPDTGNSPSTGVDNYQTLQADNGARHVLSNGLTIGNGVTADDGTLENSTATADTDDGVTFSETLEIGDSSFSVSVDVNLPSGISSANLVGWIDFNRDGAFTSSEAVSQTVTTDGVTNLTWNGINDTNYPGIADGSTFARFRLSSDSQLASLDDTDSIGELSDGEVEDYQITIGRDYGDAPDVSVGETGINPGEYSTTQADGGPSHGILNGLSIGSIVDVDSGSLQNANASQDDTDGSDDEDGVTFSTTLAASDTSYRVSVDVTNTTGSDAVLTGWIDFDQSGTFDNDERVSTIFSSSGTQNLIWDSLPGLVEGTTAARFRLSTDFTTTTETVVTGTNTTTIYSEDFEGISAWRTDGELGVTGDTATSGIWEIGSSNGYNSGGIDLQLAANGGSNLLVTDGTFNGGNNNVSGNSTADFTTARSDTFTLDSGSGTHSINFAYFLSSLSSNTTDDTNPDQFTLDIVNDANTIDRANIFTDIVISGTTQEAVWTEINRAINSSFNGKTVYLEFTAQDGGSEDIVEAGVDDITITYTEDVTGNVEVPDPLNPTGALDNGEVEDYIVGVSQRDYGDAPDTTASEVTGDYQTTADNNGASHLIVNNLRIGSLIDADSGTLQNAAASADNITDDNDEDGVTFDSDLDVNTTSYSTTVTVTNETGNNATLVGWIDFDQDGVFESEEAVRAIIPTGNINEDISLTWDNNDANNTSTTNLSGNGDLPGTGGLSGVTLATGTTYARFRLTTDDDPDGSDSLFDGDDALGAVDDGEVEDYQIIVNLDYGDARDTGIGTGTSNFNTTAEDNGASHVITSNAAQLTIGNTVDADDGTAQDADALADDSDSLINQLSYEYFDLAFQPNSVSQIPASNPTVVGTLDPDADSGNLVPQADQGDTEDFGIRYSGSILITTPGEYTFYTSSDDGSTLAIDGTQVVNNDGVHPVETQQGNFTFTSAGYYPIEIEFFERGGGQSLTIEYESSAAGVARQNIPASVLSTGINDEDGISSFAILQTDDGSYSVDVAVTNNTGNTATLIGWIDFDQSGTFDQNEAVSASVPDETTTAVPVNLNWTSLPEDITDGLTYARFRLSTDDDLTTSFATGQLDDGEVEDYIIDIEGVDYGDAPDASIGVGTANYQTTQADSGASHIIVSGLKLGATVDAENGTFQNTAADADDTTNNNDDDDEDGVTFGAILDSSALPTSYTVDIDFTNDTSSDALITGWIDFDQSGTFDADEVATRLVSPSIFDDSTTLSWDAFPGIVSGNTYARFLSVMNLQPLLPQLPLLLKTLKEQSLVGQLTLTVMMVQIVLLKVNGSSLLYKLMLVAMAFSSNQIALVAARF